MVKKKTKFVTSKELLEATKKVLEERGIDLSRVSELVYNLQKPYSAELEFSTCEKAVEEVLMKRELQHAILVGAELDRLAEERKLSEPLQSLIEQDEGLFGVDETLAIGATFTYGSIAVTTFGYLDKEKQGIIKELDTTEDSVNTFMDDLVGSIAANAAARVAHRTRDELEKEE